MTEALDLRILLVEDDDVAAEAVTRGLRRCGITAPVIWAEDGEAALRVLRGADPERRVPRPRVVLLDLNMPRMDGRETLAAIKTDEGLKSIPVVILTTSGATPDIVSSYQHRANAYVTKPFGLDEFEKTVRTIDRFYREVALLPPTD